MKKLTEKEAYEILVAQLFVYTSPDDNHHMSINEVENDDTNVLITFSTLRGKSSIIRLLATKEELLNGTVYTTFNNYCLLMG